MWFEPIGLEQATAEPVARHKARRFAGELVVDLCCGIGGDALALAEHSRVLAVDAERGMCRRTLWNGAAYDVADHLLAILGRAEQFPRPARGLVHMIRTGGRGVGFGRVTCRGMFPISTC